MRKISKTGIIAIISVSAVIGIFLIYALVCVGLTFVPMLQMNKINETATGNFHYPTETIVLENGAKLHVFPAEGPKNKYVVICPGGGYIALSKGSEGYAVAGELNRMGYTAFVLEYHVASNITSFQGPIEELASAIRYVDKNAQKYNVYAGLYALCGFSAGGNLIGLFGTHKYGYSNFEDVKKPNALIMGYPWCNPNNDGAGLNFVKKIYFDTINDKAAEVFLKGDEDLDHMRVPLWVTEDYPRTFIMHGDSDSVIPADTNSDVLAAKLEEMGVDYVYKKCPGVNHGCGLALGTSAEGWLAEAMAFADEKWYEEEFTPEPITCSELVDRTGGFISGVCHPFRKTDELTELGSDWVRIDISCVPYMGNGDPHPYYDYFREDIIYYAERGFKVFAVTPYPKDYIACGIDPRTEEGKIKVMEIMRFYIEDLGPYVSAFQITNEMSEPQFRAPLTVQEAADFIGIQLRTAHRYRGNIVVGYNYSATDYNALAKWMKPYNDYSDFVGLDLYLGCFENTSGRFGFAAAEVWMLDMRKNTNRPIVFTEFGYISEGDRKTDEEKLEILHRYGAVGDTVAAAEYYAITHIHDFIYDEDFPVSLRERLELVCKDDEEIAEALFGGGGINIDLSAHLYMELAEGIYVDGYPHTLEGQAQYFEDIYDQIFLSKKYDYLCGVIMYCFCDSERCYVCGQTHCPVETGWGLLDREGNKKPSFYVIKEAFEKAKQKEISKR